MFSSLFKVSGEPLETSLAGYPPLEKTGKLTKVTGLYKLISDERGSATESLE